MSTNQFEKLINEGDSRVETIVNDTFNLTDNLSFKTHDNF